MQPEENVNAGEGVKRTETLAQEDAMAQGALGGKSSDETVKMSKKQIVGLVVLSLIAIGGVLFGVYGMNSQNEQIAQLTVRATDAEGKVAQLETGKITITDPDGGTTEITDSISNYQNPVIVSMNSEEEYKVHFYSESLADSGQRLRIMVDNGEIYSCSVDTPVDEYSWSGSECNINGLSGKIYKIVEFGAGHMNIDDQIGFIMTDGTVQYLPLYDSIQNNDFSIRGTLRIDSYVTDAIKITVGSTTSPVGGYVSTVFVMNDDSYIKYNESMLE